MKKLIHKLKIPLKLSVRHDNSIWCPLCKENEEYPFTSFRHTLGYHETLGVTWKPTKGHKMYFWQRYHETNVL